MLYFCLIIKKRSELENMLSLILISKFLAHFKLFYFHYSSCFEALLAISMPNNERCKILVEKLHLRCIVTFHLPLYPSEGFLMVFLLANWLIVGSSVHFNESKSAAKLLFCEQIV